MNIYIANLSYSITDEDLMDLFNEYGPVASAKVVMDRETGRSRGFGFVEMEDADGEKAIEELNNAEYEGKTISVSVARPRAERPAGGGYNRGGGSGVKPGGGGGYNIQRNFGLSIL
ncbi:MAG: RNA-binding protein [Tannerellaceae bacterium]|nr:RNA-binding protein [Tannerellaceae bacterium]